MKIFVSGGICSNQVRCMSIKKRIALRGLIPKNIYSNEFDVTVRMIIGYCYALKPLETVQIDLKLLNFVQHFISKPFKLHFVLCVKLIYE